jgi:hypothetical protein
MQVRRFHANSESRPATEATGKSDTRTARQRRAGDQFFGYAVALLRASLPGQASRCACFSPRFRFLLDSSFCSRLRGEDLLARGEWAGQLCSTSLFHPSPSPATCEIAPGIKRVVEPSRTTARITERDTSTSHSKNTAPWNWIVQRS